MCFNCCSLAQTTMTNTRISTRTDAKELRLLQKHLQKAPQRPRKPAPAELQPCVMLCRRRGQSCWASGAFLAVKRPKQYDGKRTGVGAGLRLKKNHLCTPLPWGSRGTVGEEYLVPYRVACDDVFVCKIYCPWSLLHTQNPP